MSIQEVSPERFAQLFHDYHHALSQDTGDGSSAVRCNWCEVPPTEQTRLIAAARLTLLEVELLPGEDTSRRYFAKPGEAEWGC